MMKELQMKTILGVMDFLEAFSEPLKPVLRLVSNSPLLARHLMVIPRAYMGSTAFEIHDVDHEHGRISIGGVEEIMFGSRIVQIMHEEIGNRLEKKEKTEALYEIGRKISSWEVSQALEHGRWAPRALQPLIVNNTILDDIRTDKLMARFFEKILNTMSRLITDEGGWGHLEFQVSDGQLLVYLSHSQEAKWLGPSDEPVCHLYTGIVAGYGSTISGRQLKAREIKCAAQGHEHCVFELD